VPATALQHFTEDINRARAIVAHADPLPRATSSESLLRSDLLRSAWMFSVLKVIQDVEFLVNRCDEHVNSEFREFLVGVGCTVATIAQAGY